MACAYIIHIGIKMHDELLKLQKDTLVLSLTAAGYALYDLTLADVIWEIAQLKLQELLMLAASLSTCYYYYLHLPLTLYIYFASILRLSCGS